jgi:hypothetical protein
VAINENAGSTAIHPSCNFMIRAGFDSADVMGRHMNRKYVVEIFESLLTKHIVLSIPVFTTWHRCNLDNINIDHNSFNPMGSFFMRRTRYIHEDSPRMQVLETLDDVASLMIAESHASTTIIGQQKGKLDNASTKLGNEDEAHDGGRCVSYDILFSDNIHSRFDEIVEWSSWTSKEAYLREKEKAANNPAIQKCFDVIDPFSYRPHEVTFWFKHANTLEAPTTSSNQTFFPSGGLNSCAKALNTIIIHESFKMKFTTTGPTSGYLAHERGLRIRCCFLPREAPRKRKVCITVFQS